MSGVRVCHTPYVVWRQLTTGLVGYDTGKINIGQANKDTFNVVPAGKGAKGSACQGYNMELLGYCQNST